MTRLLICGSRLADETMLDYAQRATQRAYQLGWTILAGDAVGVDKAVAQQAQYLSRAVPVLIVYGLDKKPRHGIDSANILYQQLDDTCKYRERDEYMVRLADKVLCIWNGTSSGTQHVYEYAQSLGKETWLIKFEQV